MTQTDPEKSQQLLLATAETTTEDTLEQLSESQFLDVRQAVADNPNTPTVVLLRLGKDFPDVITANPKFKLLLVEDPNSQFVRLSLARSSTTSQETLSYLAEIANEEILCAVAGNPVTPASVLEKLVKSTPQFSEYGEDVECLMTYVAKNPNTSPKLLVDLAKDYGSSVSYAIAQNPKASVDLLENFARWRNTDMHQFIVQNPNTPAQILEILAGESRADIRKAVKAHPNVSQNAIEIADFIAGEPGVSIQILERLASDHRVNVRAIVAEHSKTPPSALSIVAQSSNNKSIRLKLGRNLNSPSCVLEKVIEELIEELASSLRFRKTLSASWNWKFDFQDIFQHPNITLDILEKVVKAQNEDSKKLRLVEIKHFLKLKEFAAQRMLQLEILPSSQSLENMLQVLMTIEADYRISDSFFSKLSGSPQKPLSGFFSKITSLLLEQRNMPSERLVEFSEYSGRMIRLSISKNPNTPVSVLDALASQSEKHNAAGDAEICHAIAGNPNTSTDILLRLIENNRWEIQTFHNPETKIIIAKRPDLAQAVISVLSKDEFPEVRAALAQNSNISQASEGEVLVSLNSDQTERGGVVNDENISPEFFDQNAVTDDPIFVFDIVKDPNASSEILQKIAASQSSELRCLLLERSVLPESALYILAETTFQQIIAQGEKSWNDDHKGEDRVLNRLVQHPNAPASILESLAEKQDETLHSILDGWYPHPLLVEAIAGHPNTPIPVLKKLKSYRKSFTIPEIAKKNLRERDIDE